MIQRCTNPKNKDYPNYGGKGLKIEEDWIKDVEIVYKLYNISDEQIRSIKVPALIIIGDKDVTTPEHANEMHKLISNSQLEIITGGHGEYIGELTNPQDSTKIKTTVEMINNFLD